MDDAPQRSGPISHGNKFRDPLLSKGIGRVYRKQMVVGSEAVSMSVVVAEEVSPWSILSGEEDADLVDGFRCKRKEVPEHIRIL